MAAHRYWRILLQRYNGTNYSGTQEIEMRTSIGGADATGSGTALSSGDYSAGFSKNYAFDNNAATEWAANVTEDKLSWIGYDFGAGNDVDIVEVSFTSRKTGTYHQDNYDLQYSDDGTNWVTQYYWRGLSAFTANSQARVTDSTDQPVGDFDAYTHGLAAATYNPYAVTASATFGGYAPYKTCDGLISQYWLMAATSGWLKYDFGDNNAIQINSYSLQANSVPEPNRMPKNWTFKGSNDNSNWDTLDTRTNESSWGDEETRNYVISSPGTYRYYMLDISANNGDASYTQLDEIYLFGSLPVSGSPSASPSASPSESPSASPSASASASASASPSASESPSPSASESGSPSASESGSPSASASESPSASPSASESASPSASESGSPSASESGSPSASESASESASPSASESASVSASPSVSPSPGTGVVGSVCWGHVTGALEDNILDFTTYWTGTGTAIGSGDAEAVTLDDGEYMESNTVQTGIVDVTLLQNVYAAGDSAVIKYRHGATDVDCEAAAWIVYTAPFMSLGFVQVRIEN